MLKWLLLTFVDQVSAFNVFRYITFRTGGAAFTSLVITLWIGPTIIAFLRRLQTNGQPMRDLDISAHLLKRGTPTMGGLMILIGFLASAILWADLSNWFVWLTLFVAVSFGMIGFADDFLKLTQADTKGFKGRYRLAIEAAIAVVILYAYMQIIGTDIAGGLAVPFYKNLIPIGVILSLILGVFVIVGSANAVNLTDGLDGLAVTPVIIAAGTFGVISYLTGHAVFSDYLGIISVPGSGELAVICGALIGSGLGFLWFNAPPAAIFMGDTGSLSLGGTIGVIAVIIKHEIVLAIVGGLFVLEAVSVIIQIISFRLTGKRVFRMAPLHHHFEKKGWSEPTIVIRFWIIAVILALAGMATLKLR
ncbi:MAG: phospho-N-acetylmuramoyl-pentapeptide-transferase [Pseudomonadota bacterium]